MARALEQHEFAAGLRGERDPAAGPGDRIGRALDHQHRAANPAAQLARGRLVQAVADLRRDEGLGGGLQAPADAVFDRLGRVRLGEHLGEEELQEAAVIPQPVVEVVFRPALVGGQHLIPRVTRAVLQRRGERHGRADEHGPGHAVRVLGRQDEGALRADRQRHDHRALGRGGIHHRQGIGGELRFPVSGRRAVGAAVAAAVEREHAAVPGQVGDLHLPVPRMDDRPRRQEEDGRLAGAVHLVVQAHAVALDVAGAVWVPCP